MLVMRPIQMSDLEQLVELASMTSFGLTSLPKDPELLRKKIQLSRRSFDIPADQPGGELYLFVMEDTDTGMIAGTSGVTSKTGGYEPFYVYEVQNELYESKMLNVRHEVQTLNLVAEHDGPSEIGSLFLRPSHRRGGNGRLLSLSRFLFMAEFPQRFDPHVVAEMRGVIDERGHSDFWDALGRHFFQIEFPDADYLVMVSKKFIAELMPRNPIYVSLLPPAAQACIGQVHDRTRPALRMLESEGFEFQNWIDIFEAGRVVNCELPNIRSVRESRKAKIVEWLEHDHGGELNGVSDNRPVQYIISNARNDFRACMGRLDVHDEGVALEEQLANALQVEKGDVIRYVTSRPVN